MFLTQIWNSDDRKRFFESLGKENSPCLFWPTPHLLKNRQKQKASQLFLFEITNPHTYTDEIKRLIENCSPIFLLWSFPSQSEPSHSWSHCYHGEQKPERHVQRTNGDLPDLLKWKKKIYKQKSHKGREGKKIMTTCFSASL